MGISTVYLICFGLGAIFALFSAIFSHLFGGHDGDVLGSGGHAEAGADMSDSPGVSVFSPTVLASFITSFGAIGFILTRIPATASPWVNAPLAVFGAFALATAILLFLRSVVNHTQSSSESRVCTLQGLVASVITPIPPHGVGEIAYVQAGTRYTAAARTQDGSPVGAGQQVTIAQVSGTQFFVKLV